MVKRTISIALSFVGLIVGAGFASGQEIQQYFVSYGTWGILGAILAAVIMAATGYTVLQLGSYYMADEHNEVLSGSLPTWVSKFLDLAIIATLFCIGFVMFAGAGENLKQQLGWPVWVGSVIMLVLVLAAGMLDVDKVSAVIGGITPFIIVFVVAASIYSFVDRSDSWGHLSEVASSIPNSFPNFALSSLNYVGLSLILSLSMAIVIGGSHLYPREAGWGGFFGGLTFGILLTISAVALLCSTATVKDDALPMLSLVNNINGGLGWVMAVVIYGMIFNTAIGMFYSLGRRLSAKRPDKFRIIFFTATLAGFVLSFLGFKSLIATVYPALGYLGVFLIIVLLIAWFRGHSRIEDEAERRDRISELVERRDNPKKRFTSRQRRQLRHLVRASNIENAELREAVRKELDEESDDDSHDASSDEKPSGDGGSSAQGDSSVSEAETHGAVSGSESSDNSGGRSGSVPASTSD